MHHNARSCGSKSQKSFRRSSWLLLYGQHSHCPGSKSFGTSSFILNVFIYPKFPLVPALLFHNPHNLKTDQLTFVFRTRILLTVMSTACKCIAFPLFTTLPMFKSGLSCFCVCKLYRIIIMAICIIFKTITLPNLTFKMKTIHSAPYTF